MDAEWDTFWDIKLRMSWDDSHEDELIEECYLKKGLIMKMEERTPYNPGITFNELDKMLGT